MRANLLDGRGHCKLGLVWRAGFPHIFPEESNVRRIGIVKFFNRDKGFGFVTPEDGGNDVFVHVSAVQGAGVPYLRDGMKISFETHEDPRGRGQQAVVLQILAMS
jgi:cold shock protein